MPMAALLTQSNAWLSSASTIKLVEQRPDVVEILGERGRLADAAEKLLQVDRWGIEYIRAMPGPVQESIRAAIYDAITGRGASQPPKPVQLSYVPSLEFGVTIADFGEAVTIQVHGPYEAASPSVAFAARGTGVASRGRAARSGGRKVKAAKRKPARRGR